MIYEYIYCSLSVILAFHVATLGPSYRDYGFFLKLLLPSFTEFNSSYRGSLFPNDGAGIIPVLSAQLC